MDGGVASAWVLSLSVPSSYQDEPKYKPTWVEGKKGRNGPPGLGFLDSSLPSPPWTRSEPSLTSSWAQVSTLQIPPRPNGAAPCPNPTSNRAAGAVVCSSQPNGGGEEGAQGAEVGRSGRVRPLHGSVLSPRPLRQHQEQSRYGRSFVFFNVFPGGFYFTHDKLGWCVCRAVLEDPWSEAQGKVIPIVMLNWLRCNKEIKINRLSCIKKDSMILSI